MNNDLISKSALMQSLRGNVLVDVTQALEGAVADQPIAYDVDKVVERLEGIRDRMMKNVELNSQEYDLRGAMEHEKKHYDRIIEIVKSGWN